ncbi:MAG: flavin reductase [Nitriliruptorales bacterium]|nr:flavin reductase [Nitriliruptorales bacterium]
MGHFASGVVVVTAMDGSQPVGMTVQSFASLSLDPPLCLLCPAKSSTSWPRIIRSGRFVINVLGAEHRDLSRQFAVSGGDKFRDVRWTASPASGSPVIDRAIAWLECKSSAIHDGGDHHVAIASVVDARISQEENVAPLIFFRGTFGAFTVRPGQ